MPNDTRALTQAKTAKKDEFYTSLTDIEKEMRYYRDQFEGKVVYCNCDDPKWSNFWQYFSLNFTKLKLKKLISTHYEADKPSYYLEMTEGGQVCLPIPLTQNGDFRSPECVALLEEADIVVTNPPFSLFREFIAQLMAHGKKFIILGNINAVTYKEVFPHMMNNEMWIGASIHSGDREFRVPDSYPLEATGCRIGTDGCKYIRVKGVRWFTNLDHGLRHEKLLLSKEYSPEAYPKYDNYDAIEVSKVADIPGDYYEEVYEVETAEELAELEARLKARGRIYKVEEMK